MEIGLGFGANMGDARATIVRAIAAVDTGPAPITHVSSLWRTPPWGGVDQSDFLNACALARTHLAPHALLRALQAIEHDLGRVRAQRWGPRAIDIDILFYGEATLTAPDLALPHKEIERRAFVLAPLAEIAPLHRLGATTVAAALARLDASALVVVEGPGWSREARGRR